VTRTYSAAELCAEAGASFDLIEWLTRIGILRRPGRPETFSRPL
jgi:hypothetical protein